MQDQELEERSATKQTSKPLRVSLFLENLTLRSNNFKYAIRLTMAMAVGYGVSSMLAVSHTYWVLLTIITILKPVYNVTRKRNIQRVTGTLAGVLAASGILFVVSDTTVLLLLLIACMLMAYSLLRVNHLGFVIFLTIYIVITFHFLNPVEYQHLIGERLIDTLIGSVIAALAARFIFPVWEHESITAAMEETLRANRAYFLAAWQQLISRSENEGKLNKARADAIVALTNMSDNFQQMLVEPGQNKTSSHIHQFVIASHALTSRISALSQNDIYTSADASLESGKQVIIKLLDDSISNLDGEHATLPTPEVDAKFRTVSVLSMIYSLVREIRHITQNMLAPNEQTS